MKISNQHHATRVDLCSRVCVWGMKNGNCFLFFISSLWTIVNHLDFRVSTVAPKRISEQSFFFSLSLSVFLSLALCVCMCVFRPLFSFLRCFSHSLPISFSRLPFLFLSPFVYLSIFLFSNLMIKKTSWAISHPTKREAKTEYTKSFKQAELEKLNFFLCPP